MISPGAYVQPVTQGIAFVCGAEQAAVAAQVGQIQLLNPSGSSADLILQALTPSIASTGNLTLRRYDTPLATPSSPLNMFLGGAAPVGQFYRQTNAVSLGIQLALIRFSTPTIILPFVFVIPPGAGLLVEAVTVNVAIQATFSWLEVPR